jgi:hypothetical protein
MNVSIILESLGVAVILMGVYYFMYRMGWNLDCRHEYDKGKIYYLSNKHSRIKKVCKKCGKVNVRDIHI